MRKACPSLHYQDCSSKHHMVPSRILLVTLLLALLMGVLPPSPAAAVFHRPLAEGDCIVPCSIHAEHNPQQGGCWRRPGPDGPAKGSERQPGGWAYYAEYRRLCGDADQRACFP